MTTLEQIHTAIMVRQAERMDRGERAMKEMWLPAETYDRLSEEARAICTVRDFSITKTVMVGVELKRMEADV